MTKRVQSIAGRLDSVAMLSGILAGVATAAAMIVEPSGLTVVGIWLGLAEEPWIMQAVPWLDVLATVSGTVSGIAFFWAKWQGRTPVAAKQIRRDDEENLTR